MFVFLSARRKSALKFAAALLPGVVPVKTVPHCGCFIRTWLRLVTVAVQPRAWAALIMALVSPLAVSLCFVMLHFP